MRSVWYALRVSNRGYYSIDIHDASDDALMYSDTLCFSLFEGAVLSILSDSDDLDIHKRDESLRVLLDAGTYYLNLASSTDTAGGNFALCFSEDGS